jgi:nucleotide-binding universal stress UspA family protein
MRITRRKLKRVIREEARRLYEDSIDGELDNLKKNIGDDIEHIRDLKDDVKDDHDEELRAEKEKERKDESVRRRRFRSKIRRLVREEHATDWGMGHDEESRDDHGEEDYTGHAGDESKTHDGLDYEDHDDDDVHHKAKAAVAAIQDLASAAGVDLGMDVDETTETVEDFGLPMEGIRRRRMLRKIVRENTHSKRKVRRTRNRK